MTYTSNISVVQFHKTMTFAVKLPHFCPHATTLLIPSRVPCSLMAPGSLLPDKIFSCPSRGRSCPPVFPGHILLPLLCQSKHLCRICWVSKVRNLSSYATTSQGTATRSSIAVINATDCTLNSDYAKEIGWTWEKLVILPCLRGRSVCEGRCKRGKRAQVIQQEFKRSFGKDK